MTTRSITRILAGTSAIAAIALTTGIAASDQAQAAEAQDSSGPTSENADLDGAIVVTARRRNEELSRVPTTVTAMNAGALETRGIAQQSDLQSAVPGLMIRETQANNNLTYAIRGQTVDAFSGSATAVVPYVNEVPFVAGGAASFFDLESLQVLKGPQGTLFGRNATGGAVLSTTARPKDEFGGYIRAGYGNYDAINAEGAINVPLLKDSILFRGAFKIGRRDGYIRNVYDGKQLHESDSDRLGEYWSNAFRGSLLVRPSDTIENLTVFQYERTKGNNSGTQIYSINRCGDTQPDNPAKLLNCAAYSLMGPQLDNLFGPGAWAAVLAANPGYNAGGLQGALDRQKNKLGFWQVDSDTPSYHRGRDWFLTNTTTIDLGSDTQIKNVFGYTYSRAIDSTEQTGEPFLLITTMDVSRPDGQKLRAFANDVRNTSLSNEIQLQGKALGGGLEYILGGYYQRVKNRTIFPQSYFGLSPVLPASTTTSHFTSTDTSKALFAHGTFDLGELAGLNGLKVSLGGRYAWEKISLEQREGSPYYGMTTPNFKDDRASWNVGLEYQANPNLMLYLVARESWRSGGINGNAAPQLSATLTNTDKFKSEVAQDFEAGVKFSGRVADRPAHIYLSAYTMQVKNIQRALFVPHPVLPELGAIALTVNVPKARIKGLELDAGVQPTSWLELGVTGAYTDATYTRNIALPFGNPVAMGPFADTPKWSGSAYAMITIPVDEDSRIKLRGDIYAQSPFYFSSANNSVNPGTKVPGYETVNLRLDWDNIGGTGLGVAAWMKNAFNEKYYVGGLPLGGAMGVNGANVGRPRMYGVEAKYTF